jgi:hypothetical protein
MSSGTNEPPPDAKRSGKCTFPMAPETVGVIEEWNIRHERDNGEKRGHRDAHGRIDHVLAMIGDPLINERLKLRVDLGFL